MNAPVTMDFKDIDACRHQLMIARDCELPDGDGRHRVDDVAETLDRVVMAEIKRHYEIVSKWAEKYFSGKVDVADMLYKLAMEKQDGVTVGDSLILLLENYATVQEYTEELASEEYEAEASAADASEAVAVGSAESNAD